MKKIIFFIILLLITLKANANFKGKVISISDGDTITVLLDNKAQTKIRLSNIDAPEKKQPFGMKSKEFISNLIFGKEVYIKETGKDKYNRVLGTVYLGNKNINKMIVYNGYAWAYRGYLDDVSYISLEENAKQNLRGLWNDKTPIEPRLWRRQH